MSGGKVLPIRTWVKYRCRCAICNEIAFLTAEQMERQSPHKRPRSKRVSSVGRDVRFRLHYQEPCSGRFERSSSSS